MIQRAFAPAPGPWTAAIAAIAAVLIAAPAASAAAGRAVLELNGPAAKSLREAGVRIAPLGAAAGGSRRMVLPIRAGLLGSTVTVLRLGGGISLANGRRRARLTALRLTLGERDGLAGKVGGESRGLFRVAGGRRGTDPSRGEVRLGGLRLKLSPAAARSLAKKLRLEPDRRLRKVFGVLAATDEGLPQVTDPPSTAPQKAATACQLPSTAGPEPESPLPVATRPAGAVDVTAASLSWDVRESFIRYVNSGEGTSVLGGATAAAPEVRAGSSPLTYTFGFPFANGWLDAGANPADPSDDRAAIYFGGGVRFLYSAHGIDLRTSEPEIEIGGAASRAIFAVAEGEEAAERQVIVNLDLGRAGSVRSSGGTVTYDRVPGAIPSGTATSTFAGFYAPGTEFGCFTVSYSTGS